MKQDGEPRGLSRMATRTTRRVLVAVSAAGALMFVGAFGYSAYLKQSSPSAPQPSTGQVVGMIDHSPVFFVRPGELIVFNVLICGWAICILGMAARRLMFGADPKATARMPQWLVDSLLFLMALAAAAMLTFLVVRGGYSPIAPVVKELAS